MEECDDGNNVSEDGCTAECIAECQGEIITEDWNGWDYWRVPVEGTMSDANILAACEACSMEVPCSGPGGCSYNDNVC
jgi:hypothetical protein